MAMTALILFLSMQFLIILASGFATQSKVCGSNHLAYSNCHGHELFYINGELKEKESFCKALHSLVVNDCAFENYIGSSCSGLDLDLSLADSSLKLERSLLQKEVREESKSHDPSQDTAKEKKDDPETLSPICKVGIGAAGVLVMCCTFLCPCLYKKKKATPHTVLEKDPKSTDSISPFNVNSASEKVPASPLRVPPSPSRFSQSPKLSRLQSVHLNLSQVTRATRNFSPSLQIGEGGFGTVYKAELDDGQVVAIKRAKKEHFANLRTEFSSEVELLAKIEHRNLVKLLGYVDKGNERLIITEYMPNGTLREHLDVQRGKILDFNQRLEISIDVAHGLTYLHLYAEKQIIHRDVKSSNILLTESMRAKVADFGFARMAPLDSDQTHISTKVKGTVGYLDPEYMRTYQLTAKSDVYSFGILLLEILTGRRPVELRKPADERVTLRWEVLLDYIGQLTSNSNAKYQLDSQVKHSTLCGSKPILVQEVLLDYIGQLTSNSNAKYQLDSQDAFFSTEESEFAAWECLSVDPFSTSVDIFKHLQSISMKTLVFFKTVFKKYNEGNVVDMVDPLMEEKVNTEVLYSMFTLAIQCAAPVRSDRPGMKVVVEQLWGIRADYLKGVKRG